MQDGILHKYAKLNLCNLRIAQVRRTVVYFKKHIMEGEYHGGQDIREVKERMDCESI